MSVTASRAGDLLDWTVMWFKQTFSLSVMFSLVTIFAALAPSSPRSPVAVVCRTQEMEYFSQLEWKGRYYKVAWREKNLGFRQMCTAAKNSDVEIKITLRLLFSLSGVFSKWSISLLFCDVTQ